METDIKSGQVVLFVREGVTLSEESFREAVSKAGFTLRAFRQNQE